MPDTEVTAAVPEVFLLSGGGTTVRAAGVRDRFTDVASAADALRRRRVASVTGALPFTPGESAALVAPETLTRDAAPPAPHAPQPRTATDVTTIPTPATHRARVAEVLEQIARGDADKVVLARAVELRVTPAVTVAELVAAFAYGNAGRNASAVDLGAATGEPDLWLLGASPELLLRRRGRRISCHPFAGSVPRGTDERTDSLAAQQLRGSDKDRREHAFVVDHLRDTLAPLCSELRVPDEPELVATGEVWHLATPIEGELDDPELTALDLAAILGPTPAVCGTPGAAAARIIGDVEGPRGFYGGAIGWCDGSGDGDWMVSIRCLELRDGDRVRTWAGGGIVAGSDPQAELDETTAKLRTVLRALGVGDAR